MEPVLIISPLFPPHEGGLPDHTDHLARALAPLRPVHVLSSIGVATNRPFAVEATIRHWNRPEGLLSAIASVHPHGPILWQYVPHMYGRGGVNLGLPRVMRTLALQGRHQLVLAHEIAAPLSVWPHRLGYAVAHRLMWHRLLKSVNAVGISTEAWLDRLETHRHRTAATLFPAPSPSNLPVTPRTEDAQRSWRARLGIADTGIVLGFFGSPGSGKQFDWVLSTWRAVRHASSETHLVCVGGRPTPGLTEAETRCFHPLGYLESAPASEALHAMDLLVLPFVDGVSERRSSFMAALAHGKAVLTTYGPATGRTLRASQGYAGVPIEGGIQALTDAAVRLSLDSAARSRLGDQGRQLYASHFDWPRLADRIMAHLNCGRTVLPRKGPRVQAKPNRF